MRPWTLCACLSVPWLVACGRAEIGSGEAPVAPAPAPAHVPWSAMGRGQRIDFMIKTVLPSERQAFTGFDGRKFARMDCESCHGEGVGRGVFTMPNPALPKLDPEGDFARHRAAAPEVTRFMVERVLPATASLLELPLQSDASPTGLGCLSCHTRETAREAPAAPPR